MVKISGIKVASKAKITQVTFYIEGEEGSSYFGKEGNITLRRAFRENVFSTISERLQNQYGIIVEFKLAGPGSRAYDLFSLQMSKQGSILPILLIDSETEVTESGNPLKHLAQRMDNPLKTMENFPDNQCHLMVQAMESWFFADPKSLEVYYGEGFNVKALPKTVDIEKIPKAKHIDYLNAAVKHTAKREYHKTQHGPAIMRRLNMSEVRKRSVHCERIFKCFGEIFGEEF